MDEALLAVHGHAQGRMGLLHGAGHHGELLDVVEPAAIAEPVTRPREADDLERLVEARTRQTCAVCDGTYVSQVLVE